MPVPSTINDLSTTAASNYPQGTDSPSTLDDVQRAHGSFIAQLRDVVPVASGSNLAFIGTGNRITGDFSNATVANRVMFQTNTANSQTTVGSVPSGTATTAQWVAYNNSDTANASTAQFAVSNAEVRITSGGFGTGANILPMTFYTGGAERVRIDTLGVLNAGGYTGFGAATDCGIVTNSGIALAANGGGTNTSLHFNQVFSSSAFKAISAGYTANWLFTGTTGLLSLYGSNASVAAGGAVTQTLRATIDVSGNFTAAGTITATNLFGQSQTWQNVTASRAIGTTYTNTTARPIEVFALVTLANTSTLTNLTVGGVLADATPGPGGGSYSYSLRAVVPAGATYVVSGGTPTLTGWYELR